MHKPAQLAALMAGPSSSHNVGENWKESLHGFPEGRTLLEVWSDETLICKII